MRVVYTLNDKPFLARSRSLIHILRLPDDPYVASQGTPTQHASVSVKDCVETLCLSSPDLIQEQTRDYSVYHLDPLESVGESPEGVPVGLGLMSQLRVTNPEVPPVVGTLKMLRGAETLEVRFALKEVRVRISCPSVVLPDVFSFFFQVIHSSIPSNNRGNFVTASSSKPGTTWLSNSRLVVSDRSNQLLQGLLPSPLTLTC